MENIRQRFKPDIFPLRGGKWNKTNNETAISIGSTISDATSETAFPQLKPVKSKPNPALIVSSEEDRDDDESDEDDHDLKPVTPPPIELPVPTKHAENSNYRLPHKPASNIRETGVSRPEPLGNNHIHIEPSSSEDDNDNHESVPVSQIKVDQTYISPADAENALRDLMSGGMNDETDINMADATVKGFRSNIKLLPHQILGRAWMRDRENDAKKRMGGILADDMGLGKTIQMLTRIVEGRARMSDRDEGWAATTLVVCPLALIGQWETEILRMTENLTVLKHHGPNRTADPLALRKKHVVITTYDIVKSEYIAHQGESMAKSSKKKKPAPSGSVDSDDSEKFGRTVTFKSKTAKKSALFQVKWWRVILDEAHNIKNRKTKGAIACCELEGKYRWCLTGTPMQNNVVELYSLFQFLRIRPFSDWARFDEQISKPVSNGRGAGTAMKRLQVVLKQIMLRRRKDQLINGKPIIQLPERIINIVSCDFDESEKAFYTSLEDKMEHMIEKLVGSSKANYMGVLLLLLRLRQACNHPGLVLKDYSDDSDALNPQSKKDTDDDDAEGLADMLGQLQVNRKCQMCTIEIGPSNVSSEDDKHCKDCAPLAMKAKTESKESHSSSAKIRMIVKLLQQIEERSDGEEKTIIFSQFTSMLDIIEPFLRDEGIKFVRYDGKMDTKMREASLEAVKNDSRVKAILISFKAGSAGLNLTACNNVILVDMWWNPALEDQAFDRAHRFGQERDVNIYKLKIDDTVEDRILVLQEKKRDLAQAALSGDKLKNVMSLRMEELLALFRPGVRDEDDP